MLHIGIPTAQTIKHFFMYINNKNKIHKITTSDAYYKRDRVCN